MLSKFFIDRPVFAGVISILITILGAVCAFVLPVAQYPELAPPIVHVEARYPGANAQVIADTVAAPLEQEVNGVDRMIYMSSTCSDGAYSLDVSFEPGTNIDIASVLVQNRVNAAEPKLPEEVRRQGVTTAKQSSSLVGVIAISSPDGRYDDLFLANYISINVKDEVARIYGVGGTRILPAKDYGMRVWLDANKLKARRLSVADVSEAIQQQNVQVAAGAVGRPPAPAGTDFEYVLSTLGRLSDPEQFADIIIKPGATPAEGVVRIRDVGRVELGARDYSTVATFNGKPNAVLVCYQLPGANLVDVASALARKTEEIRKNLPQGMEIKYFYDASMFIRASLEEVVVTLLEAFALVAIVVLVFLQNWRTTLIPMITIPVSLVGSLMFMLAFGFSINMLTMFGMVLAIGIVVDDAIVVVENVERNMAEHHLGPYEATIRAMGEITGPVVAITLVLMSVFLPAAALPGITGQMYRQFALTIAASTGLSAVCALSLSPALCAVLLKPHDPNPKSWLILRPLSWAAGVFNRAFDFITSLYAGLSRLAIRFYALTLLLFAGIVVLSVVLFQRVPTGFVPNEDLGFVVVATQLPDGASLERTTAVINKVSDIVQKVPGVANVVALSGFSLLDGNGSSYANCWIVLDPWDERVKSKRGVDVIMNDIRRQVGSIQEASFLVFSLPAITGLGNTSGFDLRLQDRASLGRDALQGVVDEVVAAANTQSKLAYTFSSYRAAVPQLYLNVDRDKVIRLNVPLSSVFQTLQTFLGSAYVNDFNLFSRTFQVTVQADAQFRMAPEDIRRLEVRSRDGNMIPLGTLLTVEDSRGPERVTRYNLYPAATVNGIPKPSTSSGEALSIMEGLAADKLPQGFGFEWTSMSFQEKRVGSQAVIAFGLGLLLVYLILSAQYESWTAPLAVALSVPLVLTGSTLALMYRGLDNNVFTQIGLVLLVGLGAKNAILIVEFARENRAKGMSIVDAAVGAARLRLRPILMTSFAFILGVVPLMIAVGAGAAARQALGTAVFGGMLGATLLGLLFTPVLYVIVQRVSEWFSPIKPTPAPSPQTGPTSAGH